MRVAKVLVLTLVWMQLQGGTTSTSPTNSSKEFCGSSFKIGSELRDVKFIAAIVNSVMEKLKAKGTSEEVLAHIPAIFGANLYCDGNLPESTDHLLRYLYDRVDRDCTMLQGYSSVYVNTV